MAAPKVLISDKLSPRSAEIFKEMGIDVDVKIGMTKEELIACIGEYDGLAIRSATKVTKEVIEAAKKLKVVGRAGIGVDNVDIPVATAKGIIVMNTPFGNSVTTAEHAIAMMFAAARMIPQASASTHAGKWEKSKFMGVELTNKVLGLIGCGNIGAIVANRAQGLKMRVISFDPFLSEERAKELNVEKVELNALFERSDFITLHTPLTDQTRGIIGKDAFAKMKKGVIIVNCARGGLIVESELKEAILSGKVAGAALDVFEEEPATDNVLFGLEQVVATPHLGASTTEAQENVAIQVAEQMAEYLKDGSITNALNIPSLSAEDANRLKPYLQLADQLGAFAGQVASGGIKSITIEYEGAAAAINIKPITSLLIKGILEQAISSVNMVNAPVIAKERNISVSEVKHERKGDYQTLIRVNVEADKGKVSVSGTLFGGTKPRIVQVNGVTLEAGLGSHIVYINNEDKPGLIGNLGKLLGDSGINIANFHLGRNAEKSDAIALVEIDQTLPESLLKQIATLPSVKRAILLDFKAVA